MEHGANETSLV
jgi:hypothetical protein